MIDYLKAIISGGLFSITWAWFLPYPKTYDLEFLIGAGVLFFTVWITRENTKARNRLCLFGVLTFLYYFLVFNWYWRLNWSQGFWYPHEFEIPIMQQFFFIDGEASYDADVGNIFLMLWFLLILGMNGMPFIRKK